MSIVSGILVAVLSISTLRVLVKPAAPRPVGDLVKVAGIARSFEPLIYFSEPAVAHVKDLQSTSIAVWDLAESVRVSGMADAEIIVDNLDSISEAMKKLVLELTKFHTHVDGDIDRYNTHNPCPPFSPSTKTNFALAHQHPQCDGMGKNAPRPPQLPPAPIFPFPRLRQHPQLPHNHSHPRRRPRPPHARRPPHNHHIWHVQPPARTTHGATPL